MKNYLEVMDIMSPPTERHQVILPEDEIPSIDQFNDYWRASQFASDDGELCIFIPQEIADERKRGRRAGDILIILPSHDHPIIIESSIIESSIISHLTRTSENGSPSSSGAIESNRDELKLRIGYELIKPKGGIHFVLPDPKAYPTRSPREWTPTKRSDFLRHVRHERNTVW